MRLSPIVGVLFLALPLTALAQQSTNPGLVSCAGFYPAAAAKVTLTSTATSVSPGDTVPFTATILNGSNVPIAGAAAYIKVYRLIQPQNMPPGAAVDFKQVAHDIALGSGASQQISFSLPLSGDLPPGKYHVAVIVLPDNIDPLGLLALENGAANGSFDFTVSGTYAGAVSVLPTGATRLFGDASTTSPVDLSVAVSNSTKTDYTGKISWTLYASDTAAPLDVVGTKDSPLSVKAGATVQAHYSLSDTAHSLYYVVGTITTSGGAKSLAGFVLARPGATGVRLSYVGAAKLPLTRGDPAAVACMVGAQTPTPGVQLNLSVARTGWLSFLGPVATAAYSGDAPTGASALAARAGAVVGSFSVTASLYRDGKLVDSKTVAYQCGVAGNPCNYTTAFLGALALALFMLLLVLISRAGRRTMPTPPTTTPLPPPPTV